MMTALPVAAIVTKPLELTVATPVTEELHVTDKPALWLAVNWNGRSPKVVAGMTSGLIEIVGLALAMVKVPPVRLLV